MLDSREYINPYYALKSFINTQSNVFNSYENPPDWQMYHSATIRQDPTKINKGRRRKIKITLVMDEIEHQISRLSSLGREQLRMR
jgi:hypothetical protein